MNETLYYVLESLFTHIIVDVTISVHRNPRKTHRNVYKHMVYTKTVSDGEIYFDTFTLQFWYPGLHSNI